MENIYKVIIGIAGATASFLFGGWSLLLQTLVLFIILDYVLAVIVAATHGKLNSRVGFRGIAKKVTILVLVAVAHQVDLILGDNSFIRDAVIFFYVANELISILETVAHTGLPIAAPLQKVVDVLREKGGDKNERADS